MIRKIATRLLAAALAFSIGVGLAGCIVAPYYPGGGHHWGDSGRHYNHHHHRHNDGRRW